MFIQFFSFFLNLVVARPALRDLPALGTDTAASRTRAHTHTSVSAYGRAVATHATARPQPRLATTPNSLSKPALPCPALPCPALPCHVAASLPHLQSRPDSVSTGAAPFFVERRLRRASALHGRAGRIVQAAAQALSCPAPPLFVERRFR